MTIADDINRLVKPDEPEIRLDEAVKPEAIRAKTGLSKLTPRSVSGIASPLVETDYLDRQFYAEQTLISTDGVFSITWEPIKKVMFTDAAGGELVMEYKEPVEPPA